MDTTSTLPAAAEIIGRLPPAAQIRQRIDELDAERSALWLLLRVAARAEKGRSPSAKHKPSAAARQQQEGRP
ncbi:MAG TPA: hypothetical protein VMP01_27135 [Pirellulaceae bacterium]|nr:hypothetical protein [Pirellulaceae bacterium]